MTYKKSPILTGRIDGSAPEMLRWHQVINYIDLEKEKISLEKNEKGIVFLEFAVDEGVKRNRGREGAREGSLSISKAIANFPVHFEKTKIFHGGIITCDNCDLEKTQEKLAFYVEKILAANCMPVVLGGGHEVSYGHHLGIKNFVKNKKVGIINFDAHFDLRPVEKNIGATSGTGFWQIAQDLKKAGEPFNYLTLGIQKFANTKLLFNIAEELEVQYAFGDEFNYENKNALLAKIEKFIAENDHIYLTVCMDVFASCYSPGVSAPAPNGIAPDHVFKSCFDLIVNSKKFIALDFAETNPIFDLDNRTAKLAASLIFRLT
jgi:formiminoglutamase